MKVEYQVIQIGSKLSGDQQAILCAEADKGWRLISVDDGYAYLERAVKHD